MPLPLILWGAAAALAATGVFKGVQASNNFDTAKDIGANAEKRHKKKSDDLDVARKSTQKALEKLGRLKVDVFINQIKHLVEVIKKTKSARSKIKDFDLLITLDQLKEYEKLVLTSIALEKGLGTGAVGGALAAMGAYGSVGALASASTGAAISGLSGVAATNATLAWLGGGALSAGGFGMAGGMIALGGIVLGPALAIGGFLIASKAEEALTEAHAYDARVDVAIADMNIIATALKAIRSNAAELMSVIVELASRFDAIKVNNDRSVVAFQRMVTLGKAIKEALDIAIITEDGKAVKGIKGQFSGLLEIS